MNRTSSSAAHLARVSALPECEQDWLTRVATWPSSLSDFLKDIGQGGLYGRMFQESCPARVDPTSLPSSAVWLNSGIGGPTESWTLDSSEYPKAAVECLLSHILVTGEVPQRHFFSRERCETLLQRMAKYGVERPAYAMALKNTIKASSQSVAATLRDACENTVEAVTDSTEHQ